MNHKLEYWYQEMLLQVQPYFRHCIEAFEVS